MNRVSKEFQKNANKVLVLKAIKSEQSISRTDLTGITGINKSTITNITAEFLSSGIIKYCETASAESSGGRKRCRSS